MTDNPNGLKEIRIKPLGPARLSQIPVMTSNYIVSAVEYPLGVPLPSTSLGMIGAAFGIKLDRNDVLNDSLLGLEALANALEKKGMKTMDDTIVKGPLALVGGVLTVTIFNKAGPIFVDVDKLQNIAERGQISEKDIVAKTKSLYMIGVHLGDYNEGQYFQKKVIPGYLYKRSFVYVINSFTGEPLDLEYLYIVNTGNLDSNAHRIVRVGGELRQAIVNVKNIGSELEKFAKRIAVACSKKIPAGRYLTLTPWPLIPLRDTIYYGDEIEPKPSRVLGVPTFSGPKIMIVRLGLGYSEVLGRRRPVILSIPPGTIIELESPVHCKNIHIKLAKAGYYQIIPAT